MGWKRPHLHMKFYFSQSMPLRVHNTVLEVYKELELLIFYWDEVQNAIWKWRCSRKKVWHIPILTNMLSPIFFKYGVTFFALSFLQVCRMDNWSWWYGPCQMARFKMEMSSGM